MLALVPRSMKCVSGVLFSENLVNNDTQIICTVWCVSLVSILTGSTVQLMLIIESSLLSVDQMPRSEPRLQQPLYLELVFSTVSAVHITL